MAEIQIFDFASSETAGVTITNTPGAKPCWYDHMMNPMLGYEEETSTGGQGESEEQEPSIA